MSLRDTFLKANIQSIIALIIVIGGLMLIAFVQLSESIQVTISNFIMLVLGFYFGSSRSGAEKDKTINNLSNK